MSNDSRYAVRSVLRVLDIFDLLRQRPGGATLAELTKVTDLPKSSMFRYLSTLESRAYVEREDETGIYRLGAAFLVNEARHFELLGRVARPRLERLRDEFQETVNLGVLDATRIVYLEIVESRRSMRFVAERGHREHVHSTALGKAICTELEDSEILTILESEGMPALTDKTITDPELFVKTVDGIRHDGYAIDDGENEPAGRCVAVPIAGVSPRAAISLSAPAARFSIEDAREAASALARVAAEISAELS